MRTLKVSDGSQPIKIVIMIIGGILILGVLTAILLKVSQIANILMYLSVK